MKKILIAAFFLFMTDICAAKEVVIGQSVALSGPLKDSGSGMQLGARVYFDAVNASGGINGNQIKFISRDDQYQASETIKIVRDLIDNHNALALVGDNGTATNEALAKERILENAGMALVGPRTGALSLRTPLNKNIFHVRASYSDEVQKAVQYYFTTGYKSIGIVYQNDAFGKDGLAAALAALKANGLEPSFLAVYERNTTALDVAVKTAIEKNPQAVLLITTTQPTGVFLKQYREKNGAAQVMTLSVSDGQQIVKDIGVKLARGLTITTVFPSPSRTDYPVVKEYQAALKKFGPKDAEPNLISLEGYLSAKIVAEALRRAGPNPTRASIMEKLESFGEFDLGGFRVNYSPTRRSGSSYVDISIVDRIGRILR